MSRQRTITQYTTIRHHNKRHCPEDLTCQACCSCVQQFQNQNRILKEKLEKFIKDNDENQKIMAKLTKTISELEKRKEEFDKMDEFKLKVRSIIKKELEEQKKAEDFILRQRIENAKKEKKELQEVIQRLTRQNDQRQREIGKYKYEVSTLKNQLTALQNKLNNKTKQCEEIGAKINDLKAKQNHLESILEEKTSVINRMKTALSQSEQNFITEKVKAKNNEFEMIRHQQQLSVKKMEINSLQKTAEQKTNSINNLAAEKQKLGKLVIELDSTVHSYSQLSNQLRERIYISQDYALQKEIQYKQLEMDYYDSVYQRCP